MRTLTRSFALTAGVALAAAVVLPAQAAKPEPRIITAPHATVTTDNETPVLFDDEAGGNASGDDPAIWVDPKRSDNSLVIVTAKEGGLRVYDMRNREIQSLGATAFPADGRYNNVDIAYGLKVGSRRVDVAAVSDRYNDTVRFFAIDPAGAKAATPLREITASGYQWLFVTSQAELEEEHTAYGLAVYQPTRGKDKGKTFVVVTREGNTTLAVAQVLPKADGTVALGTPRLITMPRTFTLPDGSSWFPCEEPGVDPQFEGVTVDQRTGTLYAAQEDVGLWRVELEKRSAKPVLIDTVKDFGVPDVFDADEDECVVAGPDKGFGGKYIEADAEGVDIWYGPGANGYVVLSSQGNDTFVVYDRKGSNKVVGTFSVAGIKGADEINGSDGLAITNRPVGRFRQGLLVTHDEPETWSGMTEAEEDRDPTNFSYVSWGEVAKALKLKTHGAAGSKAGNDPRFR